MAITKIQSESLNLADTYDFTGTVTGAGGVNTPAFLAYPSSNQSISNTTQTVVAFNTEIFDTDSCYDTSTYRFTPNVAGKYFVYAQTCSNSVSTFDAWETQIYKNGTSGTAIAFAGVKHFNKDSMPTSAVVDMNGSSDYLTVTCFQNRGGSTDLRGLKYWSFFGAYKIIE
nr:complement C1q protein [uncultured Mediterranean phage uvMED]